MTDKTERKWREAGPLLGMFAAAFLLYMGAFYLTFRSVGDAYGLGPVSFPDDAAHVIFAPARLLDEHVFGLQPRIKRASEKVR